MYYFEGHEFWAFLREREWPLQIMVHKCAGVTENQREASAHALTRAENGRVRSQEEAWTAPVTL